MADLFDEFQRHPDIVSRPRGENGVAKAWCPWHDDRAGGKPSLTINPKKRIVKCFACGNGGTMALAEAWGIPIDQANGSQRREIEQTYGYQDEDGTLLFQVVRFKVPSGAEKKFSQRRPDPSDPNAWVWNLNGVSKVLYRLPELRAADQHEWVWVVEGEKDVDRLRSLGLIATTNPGGASRGKSKWTNQHTKELRDRLVAVIPDNDEPGIAHANTVATKVQAVAQVVKCVDLPDISHKGDASDWLDAGHTIEELQELLGRTLAFEPNTEDDEDYTNDDRPDWKISPLLSDSNKLTRLLSSHGYFVNGGADAYFFDHGQRLLVYLDKDDRDLRILLGERYSINRQDQLYPYLLEHLLREAHIRGRHSLVRQFSYYDQDSNIAYLDMGASRLLKISPDTIEIRDNGQDGVLFLPMPEQEPWDYKPGHRPRLLRERVISKVNFTEEGSEFTDQQQRALLLAWMLSMAFESMMPTKVIAMAVGPGESGKSSLFRTVGRILIGRDFEVDSLLQDQKGEEDFWVSLAHSFFVCYDNVDQVVRWLPDALAQVATGIRRSKRQLHTTSQLHRTKVSCMLAVTARTPTASLRREDVAGRTLVFSMKPLDAKRPEYEIQDEIIRLRDELMSDYAGMVQKALQTPLAEVEVADPGMRMADFARVATWIGKGLGAEMGDLMDEVVSRIRLSQYRFATEEDSLTTLLSIWLTRSQPMTADGFDLGDTPNAGRKVTTRELLLELNAIAKEYDMRLRAGSPSALGRQITNLETALSQLFLIKKGHTKNGNFWTFEIRPSGEDAEL